MGALARHPDGNSEGSMKTYGYKVSNQKSDLWAQRFRFKVYPLICTDVEERPAQLQNEKPLNSDSCPRRTSTYFGAHARAMLIETLNPRPP